LKETISLNNVGLCHKCKSFDNLTKEEREQVKKGGHCIDVINQSPRMITKLASRSKWNLTEVAGVVINQSPLQSKGLQLYATSNTAYYVEQEYL